MKPIPAWATHVDSEGNFWANKNYIREVTDADFNWTEIVTPCAWMRNSEQPYLRTLGLFGTTMKGTTNSPPSNDMCNWYSLYTVADYELLRALEGKLFKRTGQFTLEEIK